ncbi:MAG: hypothetical protein FJ271_24525 [Planctomycetes bacterium]|nr:hypothetical protein [Planctomycetota bacterium]
MPANGCEIELGMKILSEVPGVTVRALRPANDDRRDDADAKRAVGARLICCGRLVGNGQGAASGGKIVTAVWLVVHFAPRLVLET